MNDPHSAFAVAVSRHQLGDLPGAEKLYRELLVRFPSFAPALCNLGAILVSNGRLQDAAHCYTAAITADPNNSDAYFNFGNLYRRVGQLREAADSYARCLRIRPQHPGAIFNLGLTLSAQGDALTAVGYFATCTQLEPNNAEAFGRLGDCLVRCGKFSEGIAAFRRGTELTPNDPRGWYNLGLALASSGAVPEAEECHRKALALRPEYPEAENALALCFEATGRKDDARNHYRNALRLKPTFADAWSNLGTNLSETGRADEAIFCLRESLTHRPQSPAIHSNLLLLLNYSSAIPHAEVLAEHRLWAERFAQPVPVCPPIPEPRDPERRIRIGYLSSDFRAHTVSGFIDFLLRHHDPRRFEVYAYSNTLRSDETTTKLQGLAGYWRSLGGVSDERAYQQMREDKLDVLIDLGGHTAGNRMTLLATRPAPIQCTLFGYPNTTGMTAVDYRITDPLSDPPETTANDYVEKPLYLPESAWCYPIPSDAPDVDELPALRSETFTFGCLNNAAKISDACLLAWSRILKAIPCSRLILLAGQSTSGAARLKERFQEAGVEPDRVETVFRLPRRDYFATYARCDLVLDPFPYNGGVTTGDALWMGLPVLGIAGSRYVSRQGLMMMTLLGLPEFIASDPDDLLERAIGWSRRRDDLADIRAGLRDRLVASPLTDGRRYVANLETALTKVWRARM